jgi:hypothetical protein
MANNKADLIKNIYELDKKHKKPIIFITNYNVIEKNIE